LNADNTSQIEINGALTENFNVKRQNCFLSILLFIAASDSLTSQFNAFSFQEINLSIPQYADDTTFFFKDVILHFSLSYTNLKNMRQYLDKNL